MNPISEQELGGDVFEVDIDAMLASMRLEREQVVRLKRSTFNEKVATDVRPYFVLAMKSLQDGKNVSVRIPMKDFPGNRLDTLYKKASDGLLWLRTRLQEDQALKYHSLKTVSSFERDQLGECVWIRLAADTEFFYRKRGATNPEVFLSPEKMEAHMQAREEKAKPVGTSVNDKIQAHLDAGDGMLEIGGLDLTPEQMQTIEAHVAKYEQAHGVITADKILIFV